MSHLSRLTALGLSLSLFGVTLAPLAHAQQPAAPGSVPAAPAPAPAPKPAEAKPVAPKPVAPKPDMKPAGTKPVDGKPADVKPKPPDKKTRDAARKAYGQGEKAFTAGDYVAAHSGFEMANALIPSPQAEYWVAKSLDPQPDKLQDAIAAYERFLANPEAAKAGEDKVADAKTRLEELKAKLVGQVEIVTTPAGASVLIDGKPEPGTTPLIVKLPPGVHKFAFTLADHESKEIEVDVKASDKTQQMVELVAVAPPPAPEPLPVPAAPAPPPPSPPAPEKRSMVPAFVTLGIAAAGAAVGTVFGIQALSAKSDFKDNPTTDAADDTERNALIADMAFGVAITLGVTGIVLLTSSDEVPAEPAATGHRQTKIPVKLELDTYAGRTGGGGNLRLTF